MMLNEGIVLGHHISSLGIKMDPNKIQVIVNLIPPTTQKEVRSFLGYAGYYRIFIEIFSKTTFFYVSYLRNLCNSNGQITVKMNSKNLKKKFQFHPFFGDLIGIFHFIIQIMHLTLLLEHHLDKKRIN